MDQSRGPLNSFFEQTRYTPRTRID